ncbi:MAG: peptidoglycan-associated lipoprotein Pal [Gammaproteobacteria bacterium]|jgi:peptidoglycan-associated lipoprotein
MKILSKLLVALLLPAVLVLSGCGTTGEAEQESAEVAGGGAAAGDADAAASAAESSTAEAQEEPAPPPEPEVDPLEEGLLAQRVVYFDFDSSVVHDDAMSMLRAHAEYLSNNSGTAITVEGHADERGTREYNIALGERRADAVRRILMANGAAASQIRIVSYGEERPAALGHNEEAWAQNRRAELVY